MARPIKMGVDYFPLDVNLDEKFELIEAEFGLTGFAVVVKLLQRIYSRGYYCEWTNEVALLFCKSCGLQGGNAVSEIITAAIKRGIFDKKMFEKYAILTSKGIQKRYFEAVSRREQIDVKAEYLLIDVAQILKNVNINWINVNKNSVNVNDNSQSKEKKSKGNKSNNILTEFSSLWEIYPRKVGRQKALKAYEKARENGVTYDEVKQGVINYTAYIEKNKIKPEFIKHAATWFNGECWNDEYVGIDIPKSSDDMLEGII